MFLAGFMGAGKTSVGEALAAHLGWPFIDLDGRIEVRQKRSISDIFRDSGESEFRRLESEEMGRKLQWALGQLPEKQRMAIILFTIEEMPQKEVAETLHCSVEAVKWHVFQGRKKLKDLLKGYL